jgi:arginase
MGPSAMRYAYVMERLEALGFEIEDEGDLEIPTCDRRRESHNDLKCLQQVMKVNKVLAEQVSEIVQKQRFPLILGGDHSISIGTLAGITRHKKNLGVIWFDAHTDLNTAETSPSGNIHGMSLGVSIGHGNPVLTQLNGTKQMVQPENVVIIAARDIDPGERQLAKKYGIKVFTMHEIDRMGMTQVMEESIKHVTQGTDGVHLSFDLDALDPQDAPGVGTPVMGGVSYRESHLAMEMLAEANIITSCEFVEVNPILDEKNRTANVAVALMASLLGEKLL